MLSFKEYLKSQQNVVVEYKELDESDLEYITEEHMEQLAVLDEGWREFAARVGRNIKNKISDAVQSKVDAVREGANKVVQAVSSDTGRKARSFAKTRIASFINATMTSVMKKVQAKFGPTYHIDGIKIQGMDRVLKNIKFGEDDRFEKDSVSVFSCRGSGRFRAQLVNNNAPVINMVIAYEAALEVERGVGDMTLKSWIAQVTSDVDDVQRGINRLGLDVEGSSQKYKALQHISLSKEMVDILLVNDHDTANKLVQTGVTDKFRQAFQATINQILGHVLSKDSASGAKSAIDAHNRRTNDKDERNAGDNFNGRRNRMNRERNFNRADRLARRAARRGEEY